MSDVYALGVIEEFVNYVNHYSVTNSTGATQSFSANHKTSSEQNNRSSFISDWLGIDAKGKVKVDCDASIYDEMLFIFINGKENKYFWNDGPNILRNRPKHKYIYEANVGLEC